MKKNTFKQNINEIKKMSSKFPKTLNEALNFNEMENDDEMGFEEEPEMMNEPHHEEMHNEEPEINNASEKAKKLIDDIRKMSLKAMAELADTPEDENYLMLKKVWSMTDRKPEQDKNNAQN